MSHLDTTLQPVIETAIQRGVLPIKLQQGLFVASYIDEATADQFRLTVCCWRLGVSPSRTEVNDVKQSVGRLLRRYEMPYVGPSTNALEIRPNPRNQTCHCYDIIFELGQDAIASQPAD